MQIATNYNCSDSTPLGRDISRKTLNWLQVALGRMTRSRRLTPVCFADIANYPDLSSEDYEAARGYLWT